MKLFLCMCEFLCLLDSVPTQKLCGALRYMSCLFTLSPQLTHMKTMIVRDSQQLLAEGEQACQTKQSEVSQVSYSISVEKCKTELAIM